MPELEKWIADFEAQKAAEAPYAHFADKAIRFLHAIKRDAQEAAKAEGATAESILAAVMKYHAHYVKDLRTAIHAPQGAAGVRSRPETRHPR